VSGPAVYEFLIAGTVGPLTRAAIPGFDAVVIPRFTILTGRCRGPDELQRLLTALDDNGSPATAVRVNPGNGPTVDPGAINWAMRPEGTGVT
jgi:hypothetical protein